MNVKRVLSLLLSICLMVQMLPPAFAQNYAEVSFTSASAMCGENVTTTVSIENCVDAKSIMIIPQYDEDILEIVSGTWLIDGVLAEDWSPTFGDAVITFSANTDVNTDVFEFVFRVKDDAQAGQVANVGCEIVITTMDGNEDIPVAVTVTEGHVTVLAKHCSHIDKDGDYICDDCGENLYVEHAEVSFTSASAMCGENVTTTVSIKNCVDAKSIMIIPQYDEDILEIVSGTWLIDGVLAEDWSPAFGDAVITFSANTNVNTDVFEFVFRVKDDAQAGQVANVGCEIVITTMDGNEDIPVAVTVTEGLVTVLAKQCSHIDEDGDYICDDCGENLCTEHIEESIAGFDATCTEDGLTDGVKCANCGEILVEQEVISALGHTYDEGVVTTEPTCTETGVMTYTCLRDGCDHSYTEVIPPNDHIDEDGDYICDDCGKNLCTEHIEEIVAGYDATCTEDGLTDGVKCANCGEILVEQEVISALGHDYDDGVVTIQPTCTEMGVMTYTCLREGCDHSFTEEIPANGHTEEIIPAQDATCTEDGLTEGKKCSICGEILVEQKVISALGHNYDDGVVTAEPTCTETGVMTYTCLRDGCDHNFTEEIPAKGHIDEDDDYICDICGEDLCTEHIEESISGYDATCTEDGLTEGKKCSICGEILVEQKVISALGHDYDDGVVTAEPTCTETGVMTYTCLREGCDHSFTEEIPANGHTEEVIHGYNATCTTDGLTDGTKCSICGEILVAQEVIPAKGHTEEAIHGYDATCTEDGLTDGVKCATCGTILVEQEVIPAKGHTEEVIHGYDATCTTDGLTDGTMCSTCGEILVAQEIIPAKGHTEEVIPGYPATLTAPGLTDGIKCSVCGEILVAQEEIPALTEISGTCGENLTWTLTNEGVLTISGAGAMYNFATVVDLSPLAVVPMNEETAVPAPWSEYATLITNVVVADGVTSIGDNAFAACENLKEVEIPETVTTIGDNVFAGCEALETVTYTGTEEQWAEITRGEGNETLEDAEVVIRNFMLGDINLDGVRDEDDLYALFRHCRMIEVRTVILEVFDINGDGEFDDLDLNALFRHYRLIESQW